MKLNILSWVCNRARQCSICHSDFMLVHSFQEYRCHSGLSDFSVEPIVWLDDRLLIIFFHCPQEEPVVLHDTADAKSLTPLPILCVEDGVAILRFSEIFGVNEPLKKPGRRGHRYSVPKGNFVSVVRYV